MDRLLPASNRVGVKRSACEGRPNLGPHLGRLHGLLRHRPRLGRELLGNIRRV